MALRCGECRWSSSLLRQPPIQKAEAVVVQARKSFIVFRRERRASSSSLHCSDPSKPTPVTSSRPQEGVGPGKSPENREQKEREESRLRRAEVSLGKLFRGRIWFLTLVLLLVAFGGAYGYLIITFADVADVPILGVTRR